MATAGMDLSWRPVATLSSEAAAMLPATFPACRTMMTTTTSSKLHLHGSYGGCPAAAGLRASLDAIAMADVGRQLSARGLTDRRQPWRLCARAELLDGMQMQSSDGEEHRHLNALAENWARQQESATMKTTTMMSKRMPTFRLQALPVSDSITPPSPAIAVEEFASHLRRGLPVAILDSESREAETDLFFAAEFLTEQSLRKLRLWAGGELYIAIGNDVAARFGFPFIGKVLESPALDEEYPILAGMSKNRGMCQGSCSVGLSLDHRSTRTGAPDKERVVTCRRLAEMARQAQEESWTVDQAAAKIGEEYHTPGHIFLCIEHEKGLAARHGHSELAVAVARLAGVTPVMVGCVMLSNEGDEFGALPPRFAEDVARLKGIPFLNGKDIIDLSASHLA